MTFDKKTAEFKELFRKEIDNFREAVNEAEDKCIRYEYATEDIGHEEGYYSPSWVFDHVIGGTKRGRLLKQKKPNKYAYKYGFDENGKILFSHQYSEGGYCRVDTYRLYKYAGNITYSIKGDLSDRWTGVHFRNFTEAIYDSERRIIQYALYSALNLEIDNLQCQLYHYQDDKIVVTLRRQFVEYLKRYKRYREYLYDDVYEFHLDENGNMLYYTSSDGRRFELNPKAINPFQQNYQ